MVPAEPPAPAEEMMSKYASLMQRSKGFERSSTQVLLVYVCGCLSFVLGFAVLRVFTMVKSTARPAHVLLDEPELPLVTIADLE